MQDNVTLYINLTREINPIDFHGQPKLQSFNIEHALIQALQFDPLQLNTVVSFIVILKVFSGHPFSASISSNQYICIVQEIECKKT